MTSKGFSEITPVSNGFKENNPRRQRAVRGRCTIGAPEAWISLVRLRPRRA